MYNNKEFQDILDSIDISKELELMRAVSFLGSYENYKAVQKRTIEFMSKLSKAYNEKENDDV